MWLERLYTLRRPDQDKVDPPIAVRRTAAILAVIGYPLVYLVLFGVEVGEDTLGTVVFMVLLLVALVLWAGSITVVYEFRRRLAHAPDEQLDEREQRLRDESYLIAYRALSAITLVVGLVLTVLVEVSGWSFELDGNAMIWVFSSLLMASVALPSSVVAWRDREVDDDDDLVEPGVV